jgi:hypothetical protein
LQSVHFQVSRTGVATTPFVVKSCFDLMSRKNVSSLRSQLSGVKARPGAHFNALFLSNSRWKPLHSFLEFVAIGWPDRSRPHRHAHGYEEHIGRWQSKDGGKNQCGGSRHAERPEQVALISVMTGFARLNAMGRQDLMIFPQA